MQELLSNVWFAAPYKRQHLANVHQDKALCSSKQKATVIIIAIP